MSAAADDRLAALFHSAIEHGVLRAFVAVAEERSFTRAAERLYLAQPWLSTQVRNLEARTGLKLFERSSHHVELTAAAQALLPLAKELLTSMDEALSAAVASAQQSAPRMLRLGAPTYTVRLAARVQALAEFEAARPEVEIAIDSNTTAELDRRLRDGGLDAAFLVAPVPERGLRLMPFAHVAGHLQIPDAHPLAARERLRLRDLAGCEVATWRRDLHEAAWDRTFGPMRDAGAHLVPMEGLVVDGVAEAAASLGLICLSEHRSRAIPGVVWRPLDEIVATTIVLAAPADDMTWSDELRVFWEIAAGLATASVPAP